LRPAKGQNASVIQLERPVDWLYKRTGVTSQKSPAGRWSLSQGSILICESDPQIRRLLRTTLIEKGFEVVDARNSEDAIDLIRSTRFDLLLLDIDLPGRAGSRICGEIRALSDMGIILIAASTAERDKVDALRVGADDYVTKPFNMLELEARIFAVLRRRGDRSRLKSSRIDLDDLTIDFDMRRVKVLDREERLTPKEFAVLRYLAARVNHTVGYRELVRAVWGPDYEGTEQCLRSHIASLRRKIERAPHTPKYLLTVPWVGYRLKLPK
jgi:DNA-binding response OmpR family regulator